MIIKVTVGTNTKRETVMVEDSTTLRSILDDAGIDYSRQAIHLNGSPIMGGEIDKTLKDFCVVDRCYLLAVVKTDNA